MIKKIEQIKMKTTKLLLILFVFYSWINTAAFGQGINKAGTAGSKPAAKSTKPKAAGNQKNTILKTVTKSGSIPGTKTKPSTSVKPATKTKTPPVPVTAETKKVEPPENSYSTAIGLRAGGTSGLTLKQFFATGTAVEGIVGIWPNAISITVLYERYSQVGEVSGLNWYFGGGGHITYGTGRLYYVYREGNRYYTYRYNYPGFGVGIDLVAGIEYKIPQIPFALNLDIKPFIEMNRAGVLFTAFDPGLGIKITF